MTEKRFTMSDRHLSEVNNDVAIADEGIPCTQRQVLKLLNELSEENKQLKQFKDHTFVLINEMIETANLYRTPIKSLSYGDDLGYWNGVYQKLKELKKILFEKGDVE